MCTLVILRRPGHRWPVLIGANRDEMIDRPWEPPGRHWPDRPEVVAGLDRLAGGSWLGPAVATLLFDHVAAVGGTLDFMRVVVVSSEAWRCERYTFFKT